MALRCQQLAHECASQIPVMLQDSRLLWCKPCCSAETDLNFCNNFCKTEDLQALSSHGLDQMSFKGRFSPKLFYDSIVNWENILLLGRRHPCSNTEKQMVSWSYEMVEIQGFGEIRSWFVLKDLPLLHSTPLRLKHATFTTTVPVGTNQTDLWDGKSRMPFNMVSFPSGHLRQRHCCLIGCLTFINLCKLQLRVLFESHCFDYKYIFAS